MESYVQKFLGDESINNPVLEILIVIQQKCNYGRNLDVLSFAEKAIYLVGDIEMEVNNGAFSQYMFNSSGKHSKDGVKALTEIGAIHTASILEEAIRIYKNGPTNDGRNEPEEDDLTSEQEDKLDELDAKFYEYNDALGELQFQYIKRHINEFILIE